MIGDKKSSSSNSKVANAVGGRTARACDSCLKRRARWFCAADDAFLCQACDTSIHGANQLASRHDRVRLQTSSFKPNDDDVSSSPAWHQGFTRKPRTPRRQHNHHKPSHHHQQPPKRSHNDNFVPEMSNESGDHESLASSDEEQLLYRVPVFDQPGGQLGKQYSDEDDRFDHHIQGFLDSELELANFAADVESLLGVAGLEEDQSCQFEDLFPRKETILEDFDIDIDIDVGNLEPSSSIVKIEEDDQTVLGCQPNPNSCSANDDEKLLSSTETVSKRDILLSLNYEAVIAAWDSQGSPWMTGIRPNVKPEHGWPDCMVMGSADVGQANGEWGLGHMGSSSGHSNGGREARVSRYREKRRTRLFSKKIRYEVRKLNAEKRPRMKGRFVKRSSFNMGANNNNNNPSTMLGSTTFPNYFMINK